MLTAARGLVDVVHNLALSVDHVELGHAVPARLLDLAEHRAGARVAHLHRLVAAALARADEAALPGAVVGGDGRATHVTANRERELCLAQRAAAAAAEEAGILLHVMGVGAVERPATLRLADAELAPAGELGRKKGYGVEGRG
jgi:hypothetical protein